MQCSYVGVMLVITRNSVPIVLYLTNFTHHLQIIDLLTPVIGNIIVCDYLIFRLIIISYLEERRTNFELIHRPSKNKPSGLFISSIVKGNILCTNHKIVMPIMF